MHVQFLERKLAKYHSSLLWLKAMSEGEQQREIYLCLSINQVPGTRFHFVVISSHPRHFHPDLRFPRDHFFHSCASIFPPLDHLMILLHTSCHKTVGACARSSMIPLHSVGPCDKSCRIECTTSVFGVHESLLIFSLMWQDFPRLANLFQDYNQNSDLEFFHFFNFGQLIIFVDHQSLVNRTLTRHQGEQLVQFLSASSSNPGLCRWLALGF